MSRPRMSLDAYVADRRKRYDELTDPSARSVIRYKVRVRCKAEGAAVPAWAAEADRVQLAAAARKPRRRAQVAPPETTRPAPREYPPSAPLEVPEALRVWRERGRELARVVQLTSTGAVVLHSYGERPRRFATVSAAVVAVEAWR